MFPHTPVVTWPPKMGLSLYFCLSSDQASKQASERVIAIQSRPPHGMEHQVSNHPQLSVLGDPVLSFSLSPPDTVTPFTAQSPYHLVDVVTYLRQVAAADTRYVAITIITANKRLAVGVYM